jgi:hypothetical protein
MPDFSLFFIYWTKYTEILAIFPKCAEAILFTVTGRFECVFRRRSQDTRKHGLNEIGVSNTPSDDFRLQTLRLVLKTLIILAAMDCAEWLKI